MFRCSSAAARARWLTAFLFDGNPRPLHTTFPFPTGFDRLGPSETRYVPMACQWTVGANVAGSPTKTAAPPAIVRPVAVTFEMSGEPA